MTRSATGTYRSVSHEPHPPFRGLIADDHPMCREVAKLALLKVMPDITVTEAATLHEILGDAAPATIVILDLGLPDSRGVAGLIDVVRARPNEPVLVISAVEGVDAERRIAAAGAAGYVSKAAPVTEIIAAIRSVLDAGTHFSATAHDGSEAPDDPATRLSDLTAAESRVLRAMRSGRLNKQIADDLGLSEITVKQHVKAILRKLGVVNRTQAVLVLHSADHHSN